MGTLGIMNKGIYLLLVSLALMPLLECNGQTDPDMIKCAQCLDKEESVENYDPCLKRCRCDLPFESKCSSGAKMVKDGCGCCMMCPRQAGQICDDVLVCDKSKGLHCVFNTTFKMDTGICEELKYPPCVVGKRTLASGRMFSLDCKNDCICDNGTYACSNLCPYERDSPYGVCSYPQQQRAQNNCCKQWICVSQTIYQRPVCESNSTAWSACSSECNVGYSRRITNENDCIYKKESRICQLRACDAPVYPIIPRTRRHHRVRNHHHCRATQVTPPVYLKYGTCHSLKRYKMKFCARCEGSCCVPDMSYTKKVPFYCEQLTDEKYMMKYSIIRNVSIYGSVGYDGDLKYDMLSDFYDMDDPHYVKMDVMMITKCKCFGGECPEEDPLEERLDPLLEYFRKPVKIGPVKIEAMEPEQPVKRRKPVVHVSAVRRGKRDVLPRDIEDL